VQVRRIGAALLRRDLSPERPIAILSGNDIEHALIGLAAMYVGIPYAPISPAYALISTDFGRLRSIIDLISPGLVFAADGDSYARGIEAAVRPEIEIVMTRNPIPGRPTTLFETLLAPVPTGAADAGARLGHPRHHRQVPVHLGLDRHAEGGDQHAAHVVLEPGHDPSQLASSPTSRR
jgi:Acyl-CoA synthetases (AMP-forming)/AMP-acid ligases II